MTHIPRISVVMCCYNSAQYVAETIESVLNQTFRDFEFIIWDDGSTDNTKEIVNSYNDSRIRYFYHPNMGTGKAAKAACREVRTPIIARIDSDDLCYPERLEKQFDFLESHPEVDVVASASEWIDEYGNYIGINFPYTSPVIVERILKKGGDPLTHSTTMYRVSAYKRAGEYPEIMNREDDVLFRRMVKTSKFVVVSDALVKYRLHDYSVTSMTSDNPYYQMLAVYSHKLVEDKMMSPVDFELYNLLCNRAKDYNQCRLADVTRSRMYRSNWFRFQGYLYKIEVTRNLILSLKNLIGYFIYR